MPKYLEERLRKAGTKKGMTGKTLDAYIYGTMNKLGLMRGNITVKNKKHSIKSAKS